MAAIAAIGKEIELRLDPAYRQIILRIHTQAIHLINNTSILNIYRAMGNTICGQVNNTKCKNTHQESLHLCDGIRHNNITIHRIIYKNRTITMHRLWLHLTLMMIITESRKLPPPLLQALLLETRRHLILMTKILPNVNIYHDPLICPKGSLLSFSYYSLTCLPLFAIF